MMTLTVFLLLIIYQLKHLIADYYWQYPNMYLNKGKKTGWLIPLASHASVHAIMTYVIAACYDSFFMDGMHIGLVIGVTLFDFTTHFVVDRWKATQGVGPGPAVKKQPKQEMSNRFF